MSAINMVYFGSGNVHHGCRGARVLMMMHAFKTREDFDTRATFLVKSEDPF